MHQQSESLFPELPEQGLMYLEIPDSNPHLTKTDIKIGFSTDKSTQRARHKAASLISPGLVCVATWPCTLQREQAFHIWHQEDTMPGKQEWYYPTQRMVRAIMQEMRDAQDEGNLTLAPGWTLNLVFARLVELSIQYDHHLFRTMYQREMHG